MQETLGSVKTSVASRLPLRLNLVARTSTTCAHCPEHAFVELAWTTSAFLGVVEVCLRDRGIKQRGA